MPARGWPYEDRWTDKPPAEFDQFGRIIEPMVAGERHHNRTATRFSVNHDWSRRGDNTKYREQK